MPDKNYTFNVQTPQGLAQVNIPFDDFKQCSCGSDLFDIKYRVTWARPGHIIGATPICFKADVYVCSECGRELSANDPTIKASRQQETTNAIQRN